MIKIPHKTKEDQKKKKKEEKKIKMMHFHIYLFIFVFYYYYYYYYFGSQKRDIVTSNDRSVGYINQIERLKDIANCVVD
jgi:hypothetical protein